MHWDVCVIHLIRVCLLFSSGHYRGLQITFTSSKLWCHSAFNAFKSSHSTMASLFKIVTVYNGGDILYS